MADGRTRLARRLRRDQTDAERLLWGRLRSRQVGGCKFRPQVPVDRYVADFACLEAKLIIELDGGQHAEQANYDAARTKVLEYAGFQVLRFWNPRVLQEIDGVLEEIIAALALARP